MNRKIRIVNCLIIITLINIFLIYKSSFANTCSSDDINKATINYVYNKLKNMLKKKKIKYIDIKKSNSTSYNISLLALIFNKKNKALGVYDLQNSYLESSIFKVTKRLVKINSKLETYIKKISSYYYFTTKNYEWRLYTYVVNKFPNLGLLVEIEKKENKIKFLYILKKIKHKKIDISKYSIYVKDTCSSSNETDKVSNTEWFTGKNYANNLDIWKTLSINNAELLIVEIESTTEREYILEIYNGNNLLNTYSGQIQDVLYVNSNQIKIHFKSNSSINDREVSVKIFPLRFPVVGSNWSYTAGSNGHKVCGGINGADDSFALDLNLNTPVKDSDRGKAVYPISEGEIVYINNRYGAVYIKHTIPLKLLYSNNILREWYSAYLHMNIDSQLKIGQKIKINQKLGTISNVHASNNHLHFVLYSINGTYRSNNMSNLSSIDLFHELPQEFWKQHINKWIEWCGKNYYFENGVWWNFGEGPCGNIYYYLNWSNAPDNCKYHWLIASQVSQIIEQCRNIDNSSITWINAQISPERTLVDECGEPCANNCSIEEILNLLPSKVR